ncbi:translocation/assembly module TamB [Odoribacter sp. OttesenSCG-928-G04]|nr:translocation/assembly module TamB [Odoribacter sp. OttesenSCG-928-G04]MDL2331015.1 translocation/assembly module TamB [Odoribacter sp. OttesenSCG-928-A06]
MRKFFNYLLRCILMLWVIFIGLILLLYIPGVQRGVKDKAEEYAKEKLGLVLDIEKFSVKFPLKIEFDRVFLGESPADTLLSAEAIQLDIGLGGIWRLELNKSRVSLKNSHLNIRNDSTGMLMKTVLNDLHLYIRNVNLRRNNVVIDALHIQQGDVVFVGSTRTEPDADTVAGAGFPWTIELGRLEWEDIRYTMRMESLPYLYADMRKGKIVNAGLDLSRQNIRVDSVSLYDGTSHLTLAEGENSGSSGDSFSQADMVSDTSSLWTVEAKTLLLDNYSFQMDNTSGTGLEFALSDIAIRVNNIFNRGSEVRAELKQLQLTDNRSNGRINSMKADIELAERQTRAGDVYIRTAQSTVRLNAHSATSVDKIMEEAPLNIQLDAEIGLGDISLFVSGVPESLKEKSLHINTTASYRSDHLLMNALKLSMPNHFLLTGEGEMGAIRDLQTLSGHFALQGEFSDMDFLRDSFPGFTIADRTRFDFNLSADTGVFYPRLELCLDSGCMNLSGKYNIPLQEYALKIRTKQFDLGAYLPVDSLGILSSELTCVGRGVNPDSLNAQLAIRIDTLDFMAHHYRGIDLSLVLEESIINGQLNSSDPACLLNLGLDAKIGKGSYHTALRGALEHIDLKKLNLSPDEMSISVGLWTTADMTKDQLYAVDAGLERISVNVGDGLVNYGDLNISMQSDPTHTELDVHSGDFSLYFAGDTVVTAMLNMFSEVVDTLNQQLSLRDFRMREIQSVLPAFTLHASGNMENIIGSFLARQKVVFDAIALRLSSSETDELSGEIRVVNPLVNTIRVDSLQVVLQQVDDQLNYRLNLLHPHDIVNDVYQISIYGDMIHNRLHTTLYQENSDRDTLVDFGIRTEWSDTSLYFKVITVPSMIYKKWTVNSDNYVELFHDGQIMANLEMRGEEKWFEVHSVDSSEAGNRRLKLDIAGINLEDFSALSSFIPSMKGVLNVDLLLHMYKSHIASQGDIGVDGFYYTDNYIGDIRVDMDYGVGTRKGEHTIDFSLKLDEIPRIEARGEISTRQENENLNLEVDIPGFPLHVVNAFIPDGLLDMNGDLKGNIAMMGDFSDPSLSGQLFFKEASVGFSMLGATYKLDSSFLVIKNGKLLFPPFRIIAPNQQVLDIEGELQFLPLDQMRSDLNLKARNFQLVDVKHTSNSIVYGKAFADLDLEAKGPFSALVLRGDINLLNNTVVDYILPNSSPELKDRSENVVQFISFDDTVSLRQVLKQPEQKAGLNMDANIKIGDAVVMNINLSDNGNNYVTVKGGGELNYAMNRENGMSLTGKYTLTDGTVRYAVPVIGVKNFAIRSGSFVEWSGKPENPLLNIEAAETMRVNVTESNGSRIVHFDVIIRIQNNLKNPEITFDLATPNDQYIQNQLATYSAEERSREALNLMIYGTYSGPGSSNTGNISNNALNNFVEKELNQWSRKYLKNAGLTFGLDSYDQMGADGQVVKRTDLSYQFSRQIFNDKVNLRIGGRFSSDNDPAGGSVEDNLVDDIVIEYFLNEKRSWLFKLFRHTSYESVLEGEVTRTGGGIAFRRNYMRLWDMFKRGTRSP